MDDGGYAKAWRHYVNEPFGRKRDQVRDDAEEMEFSLGLEGENLAIVRDTAQTISAFLQSVSALAPNGSTALKTKALAAIDNMERALNGSD